MLEVRKKIKHGLADPSKEDPFELFLSATNIRFCYYNETHNILGSTYGMLVLQDFEAMTPNILARTIETVQGGGIVVLLLRTVSSLKQLYHLTMVRACMHAAWRATLFFRPARGTDTCEAGRALALRDRGAQGRGPALQ